MIPMIPSKKAEQSTNRLQQDSLEVAETRAMGYYVADARPSHDMARMVNDLCEEVHEANQTWWEDLETGQPIERNFGELIALAHSELSEALEGHRKNLMDDKLPHRPMVEVELADTVIRIFDTARGLRLDLGGAMAEKMIYNASRVDHTHEHRKGENGKKY